MALSRTEAWGTRKKRQLVGVWGIIDECLVRSHWDCQSMKDAIVFTYGRQQTVDTGNSLEMNKIKYYIRVCIWSQGENRKSYTSIDV